MVLRRTGIASAGVGLTTVVRLNRVFAGGGLLGRQRFGFGDRRRGRAMGRILGRLNQCVQLRLAGIDLRGCVGDLRRDRVLGAYGRRLDLLLSAGSGLARVRRIVVGYRDRTCRRAIGVAGRRSRLRFRLCGSDGRRRRIVLRRDR